MTTVAIQSQLDECSFDTLLLVEREDAASREDAVMSYKSHVWVLFVDGLCCRLPICPSALSFYRRKMPGCGKHMK
jgi:hypothetical protein